MIGNKLKMKRKGYNITLHELADRTGLSVSYLSNLERDATSPTLENLQTICTALEIDMIALIKDSMHFKPVVRVCERKPIFVTSHRTQYAMISDPNQNLRASIMTLKSDYYGEEVSYGHEIDEINIIVKGSFLFTLNEKEYILNEGDAIYIQANCPHRYRKVSEGDCVLFCVKDNKF